MFPGASVTYYPQFRTYFCGYKVQNLFISQKMSIIVGANPIIIVRAHMKSFFKTALAVLVGVTFSVILLILLGASILGGITAGKSGSMPIKDNSVLVISLDGGIQERSDAATDALSTFTGKKDVCLDVLLQAIKEAKTNKNIKGIYLEGGSPATEPASLQELRLALQDFKESGKWIYSHADNYTGGGYYVCSVADEMTVNPIGTIDWHGLASEPIFFKEALEKIGVKVQVFKVGTYKSAVEPFINTEMSEANREQVTAFLGSIWSNMLSDVALSRQMSEEKLNAVADSFPAMQPTAKAVEWGLVDELAYTDQAKDKLKKRLKLAPNDKVNTVTPNQVVDNIIVKDKKEKAVAVYYAWGDIVNEPAENLMMGGGHSIVGSVVANDLRKLREDPDVKAVVLRVNSGGGSVFASEEIWREMELLKKDKKVVVSMGGMAASGGYYISCPANKIYAQPITLTGSIGVFGMIPDASDLMTNKIGLHFDVVKTNEMSDMGAMGRPFNEQESRLIQANVENTYKQFIQRVSDGRGLPADSVRQIAEGRVWTGEQALRLGLVDELGSLDDAIAEAAQLAKLGKYRVQRYPAPKSMFEQLFSGETTDNYINGKVRDIMGSTYEVMSLANSLAKQDRIQARIPFMLNIR